MAKQFFTNGTGSQQTLHTAQNEKIPVYDSMADVEADLANLSEEQIVATKDTGDELAQPVDVVESGNMHAVTSDAVSRSQSYINAENPTGEKYYSALGTEFDVFTKQFNLNSSTYSDSGNRRLFQFNFTLSSDAVSIINSEGYVLFVSPSSATGYHRRYTFGSTVVSGTLSIYFATSVYYNQDNNSLVVSVIFDKSVFPITEINGYVRVKYIKES